MSISTKLTSKAGGMGTRIVPGRGMRLLGICAMAACLPYLLLKAAWVAGWDIGVVRLPFPRPVWVAANLGTFVMDLTAAGLAYLLAAPRRTRRLPAPLIALPMFAATGLLSMIVIAVPLGLLMALFGGPSPVASDDSLRSWVYVLVYGGFMAEAATLLTMFGSWARQRFPRGVRPARGPGGATGAAAAAGWAAVILLAASAAGWTTRAAAGGGPPMMPLLDGTIAAMALFTVAAVGRLLMRGGDLRAWAAAWVGLSGTALPSFWMGLSLAVPSSRAGMPAWYPWLCAADLAAGLVLIGLGWAELRRAAQELNGGQLTLLLGEQPVLAAPAPPREGRRP